LVEHSPEEGRVTSSILVLGTSESSIVNFKKMVKPAQKSPDFPNAFYRVTAKGICVKDGKVLLVHDFTGRSDVDSRPEWELPGGGLDFGESFADAIKREVKEETNLTVTKVDDRPAYVWTTWHGTGRGMEWYYVCTAIFRIEIADFNFTPTKECKEIRFFTKEDLKANYEDLAAQIKPLAEKFDPKEWM
jgi:8-oxo-dGTP diphosphatase